MVDISIYFPLSYKRQAAYLHSYSLLYHIFSENAICFKEFLQFNYIFNTFLSRAVLGEQGAFQYDICGVSKSTKNSTTNRLKFSHLYFLTKFLAKNRTKWIFTNCGKWCIIKSRVKSRSASALYLSCTACVFSAKYQANDITTH